MTVVRGNNGGSWSGGHSKPGPVRNSQPIVDNTVKPQVQQKFTNFTFESWTIAFQEAEPFAWYISHMCSEKERGTCSDESLRIIKYGPDSSVGDIQGTTVKFEQPGQKELETEIRCYKCKEALPKYSYLILRRTQKFLLRGKMPFKKREVE